MTFESMTPCVLFILPLIKHQVSCLKGIAAAVLSAPTAKSQSAPEVLCGPQWAANKTLVNMNSSPNLKYPGIDITVVRPEIWWLYHNPWYHKFLFSPQPNLGVFEPQLLQKASVDLLNPIHSLFLHTSSTALLGLSLVGWGKTFGVHL